MTNTRDKKVPVAAHPVVRALFLVINDRELSSKQVEERSGIPWKSIAQWDRHSPVLSNLVAVLDALDLELTVKRK